MSSMNIGILAHVDAGKTSLTERLLYDRGVIRSLGSVDQGNTQTDSLALERQRGITIKAAVTSFLIDDVTANLLDTPGHPDFIAEVERVLSVLDGAVLVVSAVEGVQPQTRVLMRTLGRLSIPTLIFVNKIDRMGAQEGPLLESIAEKLSPSIFAMGQTRNLGTRSASFVPFGDTSQSFATNLAEVLSEHDDKLMAEYLGQHAVLPHQHLRRELAAQTAKALVHPVFFGSAITGAGVPELVSGIRELLPRAEGDENGPLAGTVFKIERGDVGEKIAYVRLFTGALRVRDRVRIGQREERVTKISVYDGGPAVARASVVAGQIGQVRGLTTARIGDAVGEDRGMTSTGYFAPPTLETVIAPRHRSDKGALHAALAQLAEQDPLINLRQDDSQQEIYLSLYGEVQKQVIAETLATEFGIEVEFRESTTICIERPIGVGTAAEMLGAVGNPFLATVGLRIEPGAPASGIVFRLDVKPESIPRYVYKSVERFEGALSGIVRETLRQGLLGWQVTDCAVIMTDCDYTSPGTTAIDFNKLTPLVLMSALSEAGTTVCEPIQRFRLEVPADAFQSLLPALGRVHATYNNPTVSGSSYVVAGEIPGVITRTCGSPT
jgi:ribosomal protection tetracycline resistance protein